MEMETETEPSEEPGPQGPELGSEDKSDDEESASENDSSMSSMKDVNEVKENYHQDKDNQDNDKGEDDLTQSIIPSAMVKTEYIPREGNRCTICYSFMDSEQESFLEREESIYYVGVIYKSMKVKASSRMKIMSENFTTPLCPVCTDVVNKAKNVLDQIEEMERTLTSLGEQMKEKLVSSYEDSRMEDFDVRESLSDLMITVDGIRLDIMKGISRFAAPNKNKKGRFTKPKVEKPPREKKPYVRKPKALPKPKPEKYQTDDEADLPRTSRGRVIKRPKVYVYNEDYSVASGSEIDQKPILWDDDDDDMDQSGDADRTETTPDPEWSPGQGHIEPEIGPEGDDAALSSSSEDEEDTENEELEEGQDDEQKPRVRVKTERSDLFEVDEDEIPLRRRKRKKKKRLRSSGEKKEKIKSEHTPRKRKTFVRVPVRVIVEDGEELDGFVMNVVKAELGEANADKKTEDNEEKQPEENLVKPEEDRDREITAVAALENNASEPDVKGAEEKAEQKIKSIEPGTVVSVKDKLVGLRICCSQRNCSRSFTDARRMRIHVLKKHQGVKTPYQCQHCEQAFKSPPELDLHVREHGLKSARPRVKNIIYCQYEGCTMKYRNQGEMQIHIRQAHTGEKPFQCEHCEQCFVSALKREYHVEGTHHDVPPIKCPHCPRGFYREHRLRMHVRNHTGERSYLCEICSMSFSQPAYLRYHQRKHQELALEPYKCDECDRTFATPVNLKLHQKTQHQKDYRYRCEICNHGATHLSHLRLHMRTHSGERPFVCQTCNKSFTRGSQLKIHIRSHTGERPYECKLCDKSFTNCSKLRRHELTHSIERPYKCPICSKGFSQLTNLNSHMKSTHNKDKAPKPPREETEVHHSANNSASSVHVPSAPGLQPHPVFGMPQQNMPPMQFQVVNPGDNMDMGGQDPSYTEYIIVNQV